MTDYNVIPDSEIDPESAVTEPLLTNLRDNPIAIAEGNDDAPRVQLGALQAQDRVEISSNTAGGTVDSDDIDLSGSEYHVFSLAYDYDGAGNGQVRMAASDDGGATYGSWVTVYSGSNDPSGGGDMWQADLAAGKICGLTTMDEVDLGVPDMDTIKLRITGGGSWEMSTRFLIITSGKS